MVKVKIKVQVYSLISSLKTYQLPLHFTPCSLDLFMRVPLQLQGEHTVLQPFWRIELIVDIAISPTRYSFSPESSEAFLGWSALPKDTTSEQYPKIERGEIWYFSENPAPNGIQNRTSGIDIDRAPRSNHCAMSLSVMVAASLFHLCYPHRHDQKISLQNVDKVMCDVFNCIMYVPIMCVIVSEDNVLVTFHLGIVCTGNIIA